MLQDFTLSSCHKIGIQGQCMNSRFRVLCRKPQRSQPGWLLNIDLNKTTCYDMQMLRDQQRISSPQFLSLFEKSVSDQLYDLCVAYCLQPITHLNYSTPFSYTHKYSVSVNWFCFSVYANLGLFQALTVTFVVHLFFLSFTNRCLNSPLFSGVSGCYLCTSQMIEWLQHWNMPYLSSSKPVPLWPPHHNLLPLGSVSVF